MSDREITFPAGEQHWDASRQCVLFPAVVDGDRITCVLPRGAFIDAAVPTDDAESLAAAAEYSFRVKRDEILAAAREAISRCSSPIPSQLLVGSLSPSVWHWKIPEAAPKETRRSRHADADAKPQSAERQAAAFQAKPAE